ncbi:MAG: tripartite tricarboxylate transporter TctB family protein [Polaromonas sp.]|uniref:tripartite tricarboxylate transporter TctB family protein n=1 Tax=Polaromonas sp. TaxID=1869339 RepID=UPI0027364437|nr:tripartite tricarboxylate transporter TctB family protein [Polaromonas sp.]MDP3797437.1 tripartite tricarboxylate transporter TctB family protein [Polaromonas sp.]
MKLNDAIFGLVLALLGAVVLFTVQSFPKIPGQQVGPALFPGLIAAGLCLGGVVLMVRGWRVRAEAPWVRFEGWVQSPRHVLGFAVLVASVVFYMLAADKLGFLLTATLILTAMFYVLRVPLAKSVLIAIIASLLIHFAFYKLLRVPLPWGLLVNHAW